MNNLQVLARCYDTVAQNPGLRRPPLSRVEEGRGGGRLPVAMASAFAAAPQSGLPWLRFPSPFIEPDVPISGIRLSDWLHRKAHGGRPS